MGNVHLLNWTLCSLDLQNNYLLKKKKKKTPLKYSTKFKVQIVQISTLLYFPEQGLGIIFFSLCIWQAL